jgi:hypothetical protein
MGEDSTRVGITSVSLSSSKPACGWLLGKGLYVSGAEDKSHVWYRYLNMLLQSQYTLNNHCNLQVVVVIRITKTLQSITIYML